MKILIVDDEVIARIGLMNTIDWQAHGYYIVGEAADAESAKKLARMYRPDIVIVDIVMPDTNGLELIRQLKKDLPLSKFIIVSCMDDKTYYRQAIQAGVSGYINKASFSNETLLSLMQEVSQSIQRERVVEETYDEIYHVNRFAILSSFLNLAIRTGAYSEGQVLEKLQSFHVELRPPYRLMIINTSALQDDVREYIEQSAIVICSEIIESMGNGFVFKNAQKEIIALVSGTVFRGETLKNLCYRVKASFSQYFDIQPNIGVSAMMQDLGRLKDAYSMAKQALKEQYFIDKQVYEFSTVRPNISMPGEVRKNMDLLMSVKLDEDPEEIRTLLLRLRGAILDTEFYDVAACQDLYLSFLYHICNIARSNVKSGQEELYPAPQPAGIAEACPTLASLSEKTLEVYRLLHERMQSQNMPDDFLVERVRQYVDAHICAKLLVNDVAEHVYLSPAYLGRVFKKETGQNLHSYIVDRKLDHAKQLLLEKGDVGAVGEMLSFSSTSHFISLFRSRFGDTPKQFLMKEKRKRE